MRVPIKVDSVLAMVAVRDVLYLAGVRDSSTVSVWQIKDGAAPKLLLSKSTTMMPGVGGGAHNAHDWATLFVGADPISSGLLFLIEPDKAPQLIDTDVRSAATVDDADRVWYARRDGLAVRKPDGSRDVYPTASSPMLAESTRGLTCYPFGGGFAQLPSATGARTGELQVSVLGAHDVPIVMCLRLGAMDTPCAGQPDRRDMMPARPDPAFAPKARAFARACSV